MGRTARNTAEAIIETGETLLAKHGSVEPWEIHKALGGHGKFDRVRQIWQEHLANKAATTSPTAPILSDSVGADVDKILEDQGAAIRKLLDAVIRDMQAQHSDELLLLRRQHANHLAKADARAVYWEQEVTRLQEMKEPEAGGKTRRLILP